MCMEEKKADQLGVWGTKEQYRGEFPGFPYFFIYPILIIGESDNTEILSADKDPRK